MVFFLNPDQHRSPLGSIIFIHIKVIVLIHHVSTPRIVTLFYLKFINLCTTGLLPVQSLFLVVTLLDLYLIGPLPGTCITKTVKPYRLWHSTSTLWFQSKSYTTARLYFCSYYFGWLLMFPFVGPNSSLTPPGPHLVLNPLLDDNIPINLYMLTYS